MCGQAPGRVDQVLQIAEEERYWDVLLSESSLRDSILWDHVPRQPEGISPPKNRVKSQVAILQRSFEILGCEPLLLPELTSDGRDFADRFMAQSSFTLPLSGDGALDRLRSRRQKSGTTPSVEKDVVTTVAPSCPSGRAQKKKSKRPSPVESTDWLNNTIDLSFPSSVAAHSEFGLHLGEASKLLFPEDQARFENIGEIASMELSISRSFQVCMYFCVTIYVWINSRNYCV